MPQLSRRPPLRKKELLPCLPSVSTTAGVVRYKFGYGWEGHEGRWRVAVIDPKTNKRIYGQHMYSEEAKAREEAIRVYNSLSPSGPLATIRLSPEEAKQDHKSKPVMMQHHSQEASLSDSESKPAPERELAPCLPRLSQKGTNYAHGYYWAKNRQLWSVNFGAQGRKFYGGVYQEEAAARDTAIRMWNEAHPKGPSARTPGPIPSTGTKPAGSTLGQASPPDMQRSFSGGIAARGRGIPAVRATRLDAMRRHSLLPAAQQQGRTHPLPVRRAASQLSMQQPRLQCGYSGHARPLSLL